MSGDRRQPRRVALVTGCGRANGIGSAAAQALAMDGVTIVVTDVSAHGAHNRHEAAGTSVDGLDGLVARIEAGGGTALAVIGDVRSEEDTRSMVASTVARFGRLDILVNNAAAPHGADRDEVDNVPFAAWQEVMAVNAGSVFLLSKAALPHMRAQGWGRIVNVASAIVGQPRRMRAVYAASKAAIVGFTQSLAADVADKGITVNAVCPGSVVTARALSTALRSGAADPKEALAQTARSIPAGRHGVPEEIAALVAFLASEQAGYLTGQAITVDGGGIPSYRR